MGEVEPVGNATELLERLRAKNRVVAHHHDESRCREWPDGEPAGELSGDIHEHSHRDERENAQHRQGKPPRSALRAVGVKRVGAFGDQGESDCHEPAEAEFPEAGERVKVGGLLVRGSFNHRPNETCESNGADRDATCAPHADVVLVLALWRETPLPCLEDKCQKSEQQRPGKEHLPLDGERPEVLEWASGSAIGRVVIRGLVDEPPVLTLNESEERILEHRYVRTWRQEDVGCRQDCEGHDDRWWK